MAMPPEAISIGTVTITVLMVALHYHVNKKFHTRFFTSGLLCSIAIAISLLASLPVIAAPAARAVADIGVLLAGCTAFASSAWLCFAFGMAGEPGDR